MQGLARTARGRTLILPTGEPAGTVATRTAGVAEFGATLLWDRVQDVPPGPVLPTLSETVRCSVIETDEPGEARREILGEILALTQRDLGLALETVLRSLTDAAALSDALLETRVARVAQPRATPSRAVQALAVDLWDAGFPVRFGPSWTPATGGAVAVGFRGAEAELRRFLGTHPSWEMP
jgi:hypothetical protein